MDGDFNKPASDMRTAALRREHSEIVQVLANGSVSSDESHGLAERKLEIWNELRDRASVTEPECPECNEHRWSQTPGEPKECDYCGFIPSDEELVRRIDAAWESILSQS